MLIHVGSSRGVEASVQEDAGLGHIRQTALIVGEGWRGSAVGRKDF
jgi:hypothetical protein